MKQLTVLILLLAGLSIHVLAVQKVDERFELDQPTQTTEEDKYKLDSLITHSWDEVTGKLVPASRKEYYYTNNKVSTEVIIVPDEVTGDWVNSEKREYKYDNSGNDTLKIISEWNDNSQKWNYKERFTRSFNSFNSTTSTIRFKWDTAQKNWQFHDKFLRSYDDSNNLTSVLNFDWNVVDKKWNPTTKTEFEYDSNNNRTARFYFTWDEELNSWNPRARKEYKYNVKNLETQLIESAWDKEDFKWVFLKKSNTVYTSEDNEALKLQYIWNKDLDNWRFASKREYLYVNGNLSQREFFLWDTEEGKWNERSKFTHSYNSDNKLTLKTHFNRVIQEPPLVSYWELEYKEEYDYNIKGEYLGNSLLNWNTEENQWLVVWKEEFKVKKGVNEQNLIDPYHFFSLLNWSENRNPREVYLSLSYDQIKDELRPFVRKEYFYSRVEENIGGGTFVNSSDNSISAIVYPNPFIRLLSFELSGSFEIYLYDLQGRLIKNKKMAAEEQLNVEGLKSGIYLYKIKTKDKFYSGKIIKD